jgi:hypothetical protein
MMSTVYRLPRLSLAALTTLLLLAAAGAPAGAATLRVPADHPDIQSGVTAAAAGDTVLVAPGTYRELIRMKPGLVLRSEAGPDSTILESPGLSESPLEERILECPEGIGPNTVIEGFTFDDADLSGTAILCDSSSPTIRGNVIRGFGWAVNLREGADAIIEENRIEQSKTFGVLAFASSPTIRRNTFVANDPTAITIAGKDSHPVIGGSREDSNRILDSFTAVRNDSRNDIDATWNDWGWEVMAEMERKGWPADIITIFDGNNADDSRRGRGKVDYRNWIRPEEEKSEASFPIWLPIGLALVLGIAFVVIARR